MHGCLCSLSLVLNGFTAIPAALHKATVLRELNMADQHTYLGSEVGERCSIACRCERQPIEGLQTLHELRSLTRVNLWNRGSGDAGIAELARRRRDMKVYPNY